MCRIAGIWGGSNQNEREHLHRMCASLAHGGPDHEGQYWFEGLGLGHRRLSILDLSAAGNQPMQRGDWWIAFNGEVYNFQAIRQELQALGAHFQSHTDTEVLLAAIEAWGLEEALPRFRGMFAFALWHEPSRKLYLVRDRVGVKPLYWYQKEGLLLFGSELKALAQHPKFERKISQAAVSLYLQQGYIPAPWCIYEGAHKLKPGHFLCFTAPHQPPQEVCYWDPVAVYKAQEGRRVSPSEGHLKEELRDLLLESVQLRLVADVPVGAFLSGGIDSSLVVALLQRHTSQQLKTFTIGMPDAQYNEAQHAQAIAQHLGTDHHTLYCTEEDFKSFLPLLPQVYDEPMGDSSAIPTLLVSRLAKEQVKVSLSADGGDELFGGYTKYEVTQRLYPKIAWMPKPMRQLMSGMVGWLQADWLEDWSARLPLLKNYKNLNNKLPKLRQALQAPSLQGFFHAASSYLNHKDLAALHGQVQNRYAVELPLIPGHLLSMLGLMDVQTYLEGDILCKVDRATMYHALEGREPLLDHKLLEFALALPDQYKIHQGKTKYLLRSILYDELPATLLERPKQGFSIPIETWLRGVLRPELEAIAQDRAFAEALGLDLGRLAAMLGAFFKGDKRVHPQWVWFMHQLWAWWGHWVK